MVKKTISENLFEEFCNILDIGYNEIPRENGQTPDYDIFVNGIQIVVEVKQIDPNKDDLIAEKELLTGKVALISDSPGKRVRRKISDASSQLSIRAKDTCPSLLVLYNNVIPANYTDPYAIKTGMYGYEKLILSVPRDFSKPTVIGKSFGPKQKMTPIHNTSISGIAVMKSHNNKPSEFLIYHNQYAKIPLDPSILQNKIVKHFVLQNKHKNNFQDWSQIS